jgi:UPF0716 protein FxsA
MRVLPLLILLGFPALELFVMVRLAHEIGWWLGAWLILAALVGTALVREAGVGLPGKLAYALRNGDSILSGVMDTGRTLLAGLLLIFPGVLSDIVAIGLLLLPFRAPWTSSASPLGNGIIEGEFRRVDRDHRR